MPSLRKRKHRSGRTSWVIDYRIDGKSRIYSIGDVGTREAKRRFHESVPKFNEKSILKIWERMSLIVKLQR